MLPLELSCVLTWKPTLRVEHVEGAVFLIGERERFVLSGPSAVEVAMSIDGRRSVSDVMRATASQISEPEALYTLSELVARGYLVPAGPEQRSREDRDDREDRDALERTPDHRAFWYGVGLDGSAAIDALRRAPVSVRVIADALPRDWLVDALAQAGVRVQDDARVQVVATDDYLRPELASINRCALRDGALWFLIKPTGVEPWIGPVFAPGGPCWDCLAFWVRRNRPVEEMVERHRRPAGFLAPPRIAVEASVRTACGLGALAIARVLAGAASLDPQGSQGSQGAQPALLALDLARLALTAHAVVRRPQCATCGDPAAMAAVGERPIELAPIEKPHCDDGGLRRQSPRRTLERYSHLVGPITGAVTHLVAMPGRDTELRAVYASGFLVCPQDRVPRGNVFDKACAGKGRSADQARASALCEALERFSGVHQGDEARVRATRAELGDAALAPGELLQFSEAQYRARATTASAVPGHRLDRRSIPEPFDPDAAIDWTPAWSLTRGERRYLPLAYCYAEAPPDSGTAFCGPCGNGVAAGTCREEAVLQAILELVERDAVAIWWYNRVPRPAIDLASFGDPYFDALQADYARLGWAIWALDLTHDLGIPSCAALAHEQATDRFAIGFGCHLEPRLAVQRALTELNQLFDPSSARRAPWDATPADRPEGRDRLRDREYLFPRRDLPAVPAARMPRFSGAELRADVLHCIERLADAGIEVIAVDKTRPDIGLDVIQVVAPGLRHFWPRFAPGRLYDVPCALGWLPRQLAETELNPIPLFI